MHLLKRATISSQPFPSPFTVFQSRLRSMISYANKLALAPMVRSGELPTRLMALHHGADLVWSPEIVDKKLLQCERVVNDDLRTIDFVDAVNFAKLKESKKNQHKKPPVIFRTYPTLESGKLIFQMGSSNPDLAVKAALKVIHDVDGIDLNCGCPKPFSTHSGMGAALLSTPELLTSILTALVQQVGKPNQKPISCKIRLLHPTDPQPTIELLHKICQTGISNLTLHCRTRDMRNRDAPIHTFLPQLVSVVESYGISFIINGSIESRQHFDQVKAKLGCENIGGMIAESAEANPSVFNSSKPLTWPLVIKEFINLAIQFDNLASNTKYVMLNQIPGKSKYHAQFCKLKSNEEFLQLAEKINDEPDFIKLKYCQKDKLVESGNFSKLYADQVRQNSSSQTKLAKRKQQDDSADKENEEVGQAKKQKVLAEDTSIGAPA